MDETDFEAYVADELSHVSLVGELDLDGPIFERACQTFKDRSSKYEDHRDSLRRLAGLRPASLLVFLVGMGQRHYSANSFWHAIPGVEGDGAMQGVLGEGAERAFAKCGLDGFQDLVEAGARRYISPILLHGTVPGSSLERLIELLVRELVLGLGTAQEMLAKWRTTDALAALDKPAERFLLRGDRVAVDVLDRMIRALRHFSTGENVSKEDVGLPSYVLDAIRGAKGAKQSIKQAQASPQPRLLFDPTQLGIEVELPPTFDVKSWSVLMDGQQRSLGLASSHSAEFMRLPRARSWVIEGRADDDSVRVQRPFVPQDEVPILAFDVTGEFLADQARCTLAQVLLLYPARGRFRVDGPEGEILQASRRYDELFGEWSGYRADEFDVSDLESLWFEVRDTEVAPRQALVCEHSLRPGVVMDPIRGVLGPLGHRVYDGYPFVRLPASVRPDRWRITLRCRGQHSLTVRDLVHVDGELYRFDEGRLPKFGTVELIIQGPLGSDLRDEFLVVPGLAVPIPAQLIGPSDDRSFDLSVDAGYVLSEPAARFAAPADRFEFSVTHEASAQTVDLVASVPRLLWSVAADEEILPRPSNSVGEVSTSHFLSKAHTLLVKTGCKVPFEVELRNDRGGMVQLLMDQQSTGEVARARVPLDRLSDSVRVDSSLLLELALLVGDERHVVSTIRRPYEVWLTAAVLSLDGSRIEIELAEDRAIDGRVARLWSVDRPWRPPVEVALSGEPTSDGAIAGDLDEQLETGAYLVEVTNARLPAAFPDAGIDSVVELQVAYAAGGGADGDDQSAADRPMMRVLAGTCRPDQLSEAELESSIWPATAVVLQELTPSGFNPSDRAALALETLFVDPGRFVRGLLSAAHDGRVGPDAQLRVSLLALSSALDCPLDSEDEELLPRIWQTNVPIAAAFDRKPDDVGSASRWMGTTGWAIGAEPVDLGCVVPEEWVRSESADLEEKYSARRGDAPLSRGGFEAAVLSGLLRSEPEAIHKLMADHSRLAARPLLNAGRRFEIGLMQLEWPFDGGIRATPLLVTLGAAHLLFHGSDEVTRRDAHRLLGHAIDLVPDLVRRQLLAVAACHLQQQHIRSQKRSRV